MDRTTDFIKTFPHPTCDQAPTNANAAAAAVINQFHLDAVTVHKSLNELEKLLDQLVSLAKYKTLFDDKTREIDLITGRVKNALQQTTSCTDHLEQKYMSDGSQKDCQAHRGAVIATLRSRTMEATKKFTEALQTRRKTLETIEARRGLYGASTTASYDIEAQDDILEVGRTNNQQQSAIMQAYHHSRSEAVEQVQRMIAEVSTMFQKVASLVGQQEEMVLRIDATVDDSLTRLREGQFQLLKYFNHIKGQRMLILKLMAMVAAFAMLFIVFLA